MQDPQIPESASEPLPASDAAGVCRFGERAAAYVIDIIWITLLSLGVGGLAGVGVGVVGLLLGRPFQLGTPPPGFYLVNGLLVSVFYSVLFEWLYGATPGKRQLRIRVVQMDGAPCGLLQALVRAALRYVDGILFGLVAYVAMRPPLYQRLGDRAARTLVVRAQSPLVQQPRAIGWYIAAFAVFLLLSTCATAALFSLLLK